MAYDSFVGSAEIYESMAKRDSIPEDLRGFYVAEAQDLMERANKLKKVQEKIWPSCSMNKPV